MLPVAHLLGLHIPMYSLMLLLGIVAYFITYFNFVEKQEKLDRVTSNRLLFLSFLGIAVLGISAFFFNSLFHSIEKGEWIWGGITWLGGVVGMVPFMIFMIHKFVPKAKGNALYYFSLLVPGIVIGHALGRVGCFFGGCCYGGEATGFWSFLGVVFPVRTATDANGVINVIGAAGTHPMFNEIGEIVSSVPLFPTQLFEAVFELILFIVLICIRKKQRGYNVEIYLIAYGIFRFILEFMRADDRGSTGFFLTPSQFMCILAIVSAIFMILFRKGILFKKLNEKCALWREEADKIVMEDPNKSGVVSPAQLIKELYELKEQGIITDQEFEQKKTDILKNIS